MVEISTKVSGVGADPVNKQNVVFLKEIGGERVLPICVGPSEGLAIALGMTQTSYKRPLTHDLMKNLIEVFEGEVKKVVVNDIQDNTYYARIYIKRNIDIIEIDARPSDSIALALRSKSPIYISEEVFKKADTFKVKSEEELKHYFEELKLEDFGKTDL